MASSQNSAGPPSPSLATDGVEPTLGQLFLSGSTNVKGDIQSFLARLARSPQVLAEEAKEHHARTHRRIRRRRKPPAAEDGTTHAPSTPSSMQAQSSPLETTLTSAAMEERHDQGPPRKRAKPTPAPLSHRAQPRAPHPQQQTHAIDDHGVLRRAPPVPILPHHHHHQHHPLQQQQQQQQRQLYQPHQLRCAELEELQGQLHVEEERSLGLQQERQRHHSTPTLLREPSSRSSSPSLGGGSSASLPDLGNLLHDFPSFPYAHPSPSPASLLNDSFSLDVNRLIYDIGDYCLSLCSDISLLCSSPAPLARPPLSPVPQPSGPSSTFSRPFPPSSSLPSSSSLSSSSSSSSSTTVGSGVHQQHQHQQQYQLHHGGIGLGPPHAAPSSPAAARPPQSPYATSMTSSQCSSAVSSPSFSIGVTVPSPPALQDREASRHPTFPMRASFYAVEEPYYQAAPSTPQELPRHPRHRLPPHHHHHHHQQQQQQATSTTSSSYQRQQPPPQQQYYRSEVGTHDQMTEEAARMSEAEEVAALIRDFLQEEGEGQETQFDSSLLYSSPTRRQQPAATRKEA